MKNLFTFLLSVCFVVTLIVCSRAHTHQPDIVAITKGKAVSSKCKNEKITKISEEIKDNILDKVPIAGKIIDEKIDDKTNTVTWILSNGAKVVLKNVLEKPENDMVDNCIKMTALAKGGILNVPSKDILSLNLVTILFEQAKGKYRKFIESPRFSVHRYTHEFSAYFPDDGSSVKTLFELLYWTFTTFTPSKIDYKAAKLYMAKEKAILKYDEYMKNPNGTNLIRELLRVIYTNDTYLYRNDPYLRHLKSSDFTKFNKNTAVKFIRKYLNPVDYTFVFVRNVNDINTKDDIKKYVETYLASLPASKERGTLPEYSPTFMKGVEYNKVYTRFNTQLEQGIYFIVRDQHLQNSRVVADVLGKYLENIMAKYVEKYPRPDYVLKHTEAGDRDLRFSISFACDANEIDETVAAVRRDLKEISEGNINVDIFNKAKKIMKTEYEKQLQDNNWWLADTYAEFAVVYDKPFIDIYKQQEMYDTVTPKDLQEMVAKALKEGSACIFEYPQS
jgi:zinc protease